ncbi:uncharacterized Zn finger protein (UPF0148 family) [Pseudomonas sp. HLS-6 TE3448]
MVTPPTPSQASQLQQNAACRSRACPRCSRRELTVTPPTPSQARPAPTKMQPVGAGLARDAGAANALTPHRRHRRQASPTENATCRSRACPRCRRRELTVTPPTPSQASQLQQSPRQLWEPGLPAMQTPRTHCHRAEAIAGKPAPTENAACRSRACPRCRRRELTGTAPRLSQASQLQQSPRQLWEPGLPAIQTPRTHGHPTDAIADKPAPTEPASCGSRACPRCRRRELAGTPPTPSQTSLQQKPSSLWEVCQRQCIRR